MTDRCRHDVHPSACATCLPRPDPVPLTSSRTFTARYYSDCAACGFGIRPGNCAAYLDDEIVHASCR